MSSTPSTNDPSPRASKTGDSRRHVLARAARAISEWRSAATTAPAAASISSTEAETSRPSARATFVTCAGWAGNRPSPGPRVPARRTAFHEGARHVPTRWRRAAPPISNDFVTLFQVGHRRHVDRRHRAAQQEAGASALPLGMEAGPFVGRLHAVVGGENTLLAQPDLVLTVEMERTRIPPYDTMIAHLRAMKPRSYRALAIAACALGSLAHLSSPKGGHPWAGSELRRSFGLGRSPGGAR